ncbi:MAG: MBL fold metallo-hydrolase [Oscillospiraceae bacterium]|nr:MBL fold metallo-hydrolase [Oscillospiraceae bacterium]
MLDYICIPVGMIQSNSYVLRDQASGALALIDCGHFNRRVREAVEERGGDLRFILLTHGHFDHVQGVAEVKQRYPGARVCIGAEDEDYLSGKRQSLPGWSSRHEKACAADQLLRGGDIIALGESRLRVIAAPGHTPGGVCFRAEADGLLFTGDTLFRGDCGRVDLPGGDWTTLQATLRALAALEGNDTVLPGHGEASSLAQERLNIRF